MAHATDSGWLVDWWRRFCPSSCLRRPNAIAGLLASDTIKAGCTEILGPDGVWTPVAAGVSCFADPTTIDAYLADPIPNLAAHLLDRFHAGEPGILLGPPEIARANAARRLNLVTLVYLQSPSDPGDRLAGLIGSKSMEHFIRTHRGYGLARMLREDPVLFEEGLRQSGMRRHAHFPAGHPCRLTGQGLPVATSVMIYEPEPEQAVLQASAASLLFATKPPRLGLTPAQSRMLALAADGLADEEIAEVLGIAVDTVKKGWRGIFDRAATALPGLFGSAELRSGVRGAGKRRRIIAYVQDQPEELRPYASGGTEATAALP